MSDRFFSGVIDVINQLNPKWLDDIAAFRNNAIALGSISLKIDEDIRDISSRITSIGLTTLESIKPFPDIGDYSSILADIKLPDIGDFSSILANIKLPDISDFSSILANIKLPDIGDFSSILASTKLPDFSEYLQNLEKKFQITEEEATKVLRKYKWLISPSLSVDFVFDLVKVSKESGDQRVAINKLFCDYLTSDNFQYLSGIVDSWKTKPSYKSRMKIFKDCIYALKSAKGKYNPSNLVIPTLIAQIDGILTEYTMMKGIDRRGKYWREKVKQEAGNDLSNELANEVLLDILFQTAYYGKPLEVPSTFSRHKILHGEYLRYGRIDNALRAFLLLDFLAEFYKN